MKWKNRAKEDRMNREQIQIVQLLQNLVLEHFEQKEKDLRKFKWIANVPQSGTEYLDNINVFELEQKALKQIEEDQKKTLEFLKNLL